MTPGQPGSRPRPLTVLVVSIVHTPLDARIHHRQIRALRDHDAEVTQVAPWRATATGRQDGVDGVVHVDVPRAQGRRRLRALWRARRIIARLGPRHDVILLHDPELVLAVAGRLRRLPPVVLDVHEDLAASLVDRRWLPAPLRRAGRFLVGRLERWAERDLAGLLLAEEAYRGRFRRTHLVVPNLPWLPPAPSDTVDPGRVVHIGRLSVGRGAHELIAIADGLTARGGPDVELIGPADADVADALQQAHDRGTLRWHGYLPNDAAMERLRGALAGLALLHDLPNYRVSLPTKIGEYLAQGVPPIVTPLPEAVRLVEGSGCGTVVPFHDVTATVAAIIDLRNDPQRRQRWAEAGHRYIAAGNSWDAHAPGFVAELRRLADTGISRSVDRAGRAARHRR